MGLLFVTALLNPPFDAARSALLPQILEGDRYVVGISLQRTVSQIAMIAGYIGGAAFTAANPRYALFFNAATFGVSALPSGSSCTSAHRACARKSGPICSARRPRATRWSSATGCCARSRSSSSAPPASARSPRVSAAAWSTPFPESPRYHGWFQGAIMMAGAVGFIIGSSSSPASCHRPGGSS